MTNHQPNFKPDAEVGTCALCLSTIYNGDDRYIWVDGALFCTIDCAEEATGVSLEPDFSDEYDPEETDPFCLPGMTRGDVDETPYT